MRKLFGIREDIQLCKFVIIYNTLYSNGYFEDGYRLHVAIIIEHGEGSNDSNRI